MSAVSISDAGWLADRSLQKLLTALSADGADARVVGGAIRNTLLGQPVGDIDIATTNPPEITVRLATKAGFKAVPTGAAHGTITVVANGRPFEVTTLRADIETDGRHAKVAFGTDWNVDANRRDFTINALYASADGTVFDPVGGLQDIQTRNIRFIGDVETRIREDYLRILRFFRFFAWYGSGRPDADGLRACARLKDGLDALSAERVWSELKRLLAAPDPSRALLWMRQTGVLTRVLPESEKWGIDAIQGLMAAERDLGWAPEAMLRLEAIVPPDSARMEDLGKRLRMSKAETERLTRWASTGSIRPDMSERSMRTTLYESNLQGMKDRLQLDLAAARHAGIQSDEALKKAGGYGRLLKIAESWKRPTFPVKGSQLSDAGHEPGEGMGKLLKALEAEWVASDFTLDRDALLARAAELARA